MGITSWLVKRIFSEERASAVFSITICVVVLIVTLNVGLLKYIPTLVKYLGTRAMSNIALSVGTLVGFLASIPIATLLSGILHKDKLTRFIEVLLSAPYSYKEILSAITIAGIILSLGITLLLYSLYCVLVVLKLPLLVTILINPYALILALLITALTVQLTILLNLLLTGVGKKLRISSLASIAPSLLLYLLIMLMIRPLSIKTPTIQILEIVTIICAILTIATALTILKLVKVEHLLT